MTKRAIELTNTRYRLGYHVSAPQDGLMIQMDFAI